MAKIYDISMKITNELPALKITEDIVATVNNRKNTVLNVLAMVNETERKKKDNEQNAEDDFVMMQKALEMLIGKKHAQEIDAMDLPIDEYSEIFRAVMQVAQGKEPGEEDTP